MTCMICNPTCGKCRPPDWRTITCPECEKITLFTRHQSLSGGVHRCKHCESDLSHLVFVDPVFCGYSGQVCAYRCGRYRDDNVGEYHTCTHFTPVGSYPSIVEQ